MNCCPAARRIFLFTAVLVAIGAGLLLTSEQPHAADKDEKLLRHVVMFKFKESSSEKDVQGVVDAFRALPTKIPEIADFEFGTNNSPEGLNHEYTHCFLLTFRSEKDREVYLPHPAHKAFGNVLRPHLDKVMVIDYWTEE